MFGFHPKDPGSSPGGGMFSYVWVWACARLRTARLVHVVDTPTYLLKSSIRYGIVV